MTAAQQCVCGNPEPRTETWFKRELAGALPAEARGEWRLEGGGAPRPLPFPRPQHLYHLSGPELHPFKIILSSSGRFIAKPRQLTPSGAMKSIFCSRISKQLSRVLELPLSSVTEGLFSISFLIFMAYTLGQLLKGRPKSL